MNPAWRQATLWVHIKDFKEIVPAKAEEKQIFNTFEKSSGYNSYKAVQDVKTHSEEQRVTAKK